ncbi:MAG: cytidine deaminase, homotetrameric [uncultured Acidilobus sp. JCHS]|jgi:cytidine deaminase|nr:MAG: cytidine deaminase, homotetrameric [uncultured Acidilobus sp. OSP8]ESQ25895.1 MAG: cytidine deaminase, homotetrameric [uncultured Acidilobus sp. JCHS]NAZ31870.1 cytidine deaminase [Acidilobus sp.]
MQEVPQDLLEAALSIIKNAYAPYSGYRVAAAVRASSGRVYRGVNVENSSYGLTVCAERVAIFNAVTEGERSIKEVLVLVERGPPAPPCGACLQVISEFGDDNTVIYSASLEGGVMKWRLKDLLPFRFGASYLRAQK